MILYDCMVEEEFLFENCVFVRNVVFIVVCMCLYKWIIVLVFNFVKVESLIICFVIS